MKKFIIIHCHAICNEFGSSIGHSSDLVQYDTKAEAVNIGYKQADSDDFNVGVLDDGFLVSLDWMGKVVTDRPQDMVRISENLGLPKPIIAENLASH